MTMTLDELRKMRSLPAVETVADAVDGMDLNAVFDLAEAMLLLEKLFYDLSGRITFDYRAEDATFERADDEEVTVFLSPPIVQPSDLDKPWKTLPEAIREGAKLVEEMPP